MSILFFGRRFLVLVVVLVFSISVYGQRQGARTRGNRGNVPGEGVLIGKIVDNRSKPVEFANVVLYKKRDSSLVTGTITNSQGEFKLDKLKYGRYYLIADFIGYKKTTVGAIAVAPKKQTLDLGKLTLEQATQQLGEIDVVADRSYVEYKIDRKVVNVGQQLNASGGTAVDVLENTPSINVDVEGNITLRGSSSFTVLIDGKPSVLSGSDALEQLPASAIESIEIITNPSAKYEPDGTAGIINVILKKKKLQGVSGILNGSFGTGPIYSVDGMVNLRQGRWNVVVGGSYSHRGFDREESNFRQTFYEDSTVYLSEKGDGSRGFGGWSARVGADYSVNNHNTVSLQVAARDFNFERLNTINYHRWVEPSVNDEEYYVSGDDFKAGGLGWQATLTEALHYGDHKLNLTVIWNRRDGDRLNHSKTQGTNQDFETIFGNNDQMKRITAEDRNTTRFKFDYEWLLGEERKIEAGYQGRWENAQMNYSTRYFLPATQRWGGDVEVSEVDYTRYIHAAYATYSNRFWGFDLKAGLRAELTDRILKELTEDSDYDYKSINLFPSAYLSRKLGKRHQLQFSYSRRVNRPRDYVLNPFIMRSDAFSRFRGNPGLEPEFAGAFELNYLLRIGKMSTISLETYYRQTDNEMTRIRTVDEDGILNYTIINLNNDKSIGCELSGNLSVTKWFTLTPIADWYYYELEDKSNGKSIIRSSKNYNFRLNTTFRFSNNSRMQLNGSYRSGSVTANGERKPSYSIDFAMRQEMLKRRVSVAFRVRDIFGTRIREGFSEGENFRLDYESRYQSPFFIISFSYKLNNFRMKPEMRDNGGGTDMDFGG